MQTRTSLTVTCALLLSAGLVLAGQRGGGVPPVGGQQQRPAPTTFPNKQRPTPDPTVVARGKTLYEINCRSCHGADLRGGEQGGSNLLRSALALNDQAGELILPVVRDGRRNPGMSPMPAMSLPENDVKAIAEYIHSVSATAAGQGGPPPGPRPTLNILVGDANAGKTYFSAKCSACHSATGDMAGIGTRINDPMTLQNTWLAGQAQGGGGRGGRGGRGGATPVTATVTYQGQKIEGRLNRIDDFIVILNFEDGSSRSFARNGDNPKVEIKDPRDPHRNMLPEYTDKDIHDVTAYLVTLK
jgi:cytochrome c oxidase cbb3-type subunit 3